MNDRFEGQVAIVTGAARGIGKGIASRLADEGARVALFDCLEDEMNQTCEALRAGGKHVSAVHLDITDEQQVQDAVGALVKDEGQLDIVVNSAGVVGPTGTTILDYPYLEFKNVLDVNLSGSFLITKAALPHMVNRDYGRILLIASIGGKEGNPGMVGYVASKSGVMGLVKAVGKEFANTGITVNGLAPAVIATPMNQDTDPAVLKYMREKIPMKRLGTVEEVAAIACWIVSREASFNTGFIFDISGGRATF